MLFSLLFDLYRSLNKKKHLEFQAIFTLLRSLYGMFSYKIGTGRNGVGKFADVIIAQIIMAKMPK